MKNIVMLGDSYKYSHSKQYPDGIVSMYDYFESRGGKYERVVFTGLQYYLKEYISKRITQDMVDEAYEFSKGHGIPFDKDGWDYIVKNLDGKIPVVIKAVPEGSIIPTKNVLMTIESTDKNVPWIAGWIETLIQKIWYPITIATKSYYVKRMLKKYGSPEWAEWSFHNFGDRGSSSVESAAIGGFAHITSFKGTDNFNTLKFTRDYYNTKEIPAFSVWASEHSTTTSNSQIIGEIEWVIKMLEENPDKGIMSFVADSYDVFSFTNEVTKEKGKVREILNNRNQKFVIRPDSGNPIEVISKLFEIMEKNNAFDITIKSPDGVERKASSKYGILWGDGITPETIEEILKWVTENGYAAENMVFGSGGDLMQNVNRDTCRFAIKCSSVTLEDGKEIDVFKEPITDKGKVSKKGKVTLYFNKDTKEYFTDIIGKENNNIKEVLEEVFKDGEIKREYSIEEIRKRIEK